jgi:hypothetical protein
MIEDQFEHILTTVRVRIPGVSDDAMKLELINVLDEFLQDSNVWRHEKPIPVTPEKLTYSIVPPLGHPIRLLNVTSEGRHVVATMEEPGVLVLTQPVEEPTELLCEVALTVELPPVGSCDTYPDCDNWVIEKYKGVLVDGLLARMMSQLAKPYTSERHAIYHFRRFRNGIAKARVEASHKNLFGAQTWRYPQTFATRRK